jgi:DNA-directed RNA polymerase specialized sigma24 family protein
VRSVDQSGASSSGVVALTDDSGAISASLLASPEIAEMRASARRDEEEESLIGRCLEGDVEAFRPLVHRYQRLAFSVALRMLGSRADAEDIAQQAFVDAFNALDRFNGEGRHHAFSTWLLRIAVNRSKDVLKSKRRT